MGRIYAYGEPRTEDSPMGAFFLWLFLLGFALPGAYGWILVKLGWISNATLFSVCGGLSVVVGLKEAIATARSNAMARKEVAKLQNPLEVGRADLQGHPLHSAHRGEISTIHTQVNLLNYEACQKPNSAQNGDSNNALLEEFVVGGRHVERRGRLFSVGFRDEGDGGGVRRHHHRHSRLRHRQSSDG